MRFRVIEVLATNSTGKTVEMVYMRNGSAIEAAAALVSALEAMANPGRYGTVVGARVEIVEG